MNKRLLALAAAVSLLLPALGGWLLWNDNNAAAALWPFLLWPPALAFLWGCAMLLALLRELRAAIEETRRMAASLARAGIPLRHESGAESEGVMREIAHALPLVLERNLERLRACLEDSREQIGMLIRLRAEQEATLSQALAEAKAQSVRTQELLDELRECLQPPPSESPPTETPEQGDIQRRLEALAAQDILAELKTMSPALDEALAQAPPPELWQRHRHGESGLFSPRHYTAEGLNLYLAVVARCQEDAAFRARADAYVEHFAALLELLPEAGQTACLESKIGKVHLLLAQARGRIS